MPRVTAEHVLTTKSAVITAERSTNRGITDTLTCLLTMQGERTDARIFVERQTIDAMRLMTESLALQLRSQSRIAEAHGVMVELIAEHDVPGFGPGGCVPNKPGASGAGEPATALVPQEV
jgi:hypothetical protein